MTGLKHRLPTSIATRRLLLVEPDRRHVPAIARLAGNPNVHRWMARLPHPYTEEHARFFVSTIVPGEDELCYALLQGGGDFMGIVGLTFGGEAPELGYWLGEPYWGQGYATEAAGALVDAARRVGIGELRSKALATNAASRHVLRKVGFIECGAITETAGNLVGQPMVLMRQEFGHD